MKPLTSHSVDRFTPKTKTKGEHVQHVLLFAHTRAVKYSHTTQRVVFVAWTGYCVL